MRPRYLTGPRSRDDMHVVRSAPTLRAMNSILGVLGLILVVVGALTLIGVITGGTVGAIVEIVVGLVLISFGSGRLRM